jgi:hypothetical protein
MELSAFKPKLWYPPQRSPTKPELGGGTSPGLIGQFQTQSAVGLRPTPGVPPPQPHEVES